MGLKVKKWLTNSQFQLQEESYFLKKNLLSGLKIIQVDWNVYKTANKSAMIHTYQILLCSNWPELSPWSFTHVFKKIETTMRWNCTSKAYRFLQITAKHQDFPFFFTLLPIFPNICLWRRSLCSNLAVIDPEIVHRAIFTCQYGLCCCISPRFCSTVLLKFGQIAKIFWANGLPPPLAKNSPYAYVQNPTTGWSPEN